MGERYEQELFEALLKIKKALTKSNFIEGLPHPAIGAMRYIRRCALMNPEAAESGITMSDLSRRMGVSKPAATQIINDLARRGYVERVFSQNDRRLVYVRVTQAGEEVLSRGDQEFRRQLERIVNALGEEDTQTLIRIITKLSVCLENMET